MIIIEFRRQSFGVVLVGFEWIGFVDCDVEGHLSSADRYYMAENNDNELDQSYSHWVNRWTQVKISTEGPGATYEYCTTKSIAAE